MLLSELLLANGVPDKSINAALSVTKITGYAIFVTSCALSYRYKPLYRCYHLIGRMLKSPNIVSTSMDNTATTNKMLNFINQYVKKIDCKMNFSNIYRSIQTNVTVNNFYQQVKKIGVDKINRFASYPLIQLIPSSFGISTFYFTLGVLEGFFWYDITSFIHVPYKYYGIACIYNDNPINKPDYQSIRIMCIRQKLDSSL
jgi:hypothetical protein